jgi:tetratricopeptide (TPR) repeat protein
MAIELDDSLVEARASLGCVLVELGELEMAHSAFAGALGHHPDYPDVHFHMARLLDDMDRPLESESHWQRFLELAPKSPWAEEARERLADSTL